MLCLQIAPGIRHPTACCSGMNGTNTRRRCTTSSWRLLFNRRATSPVRNMHSSGNTPAAPDLHAYQHAFMQAMAADLKLNLTVKWMSACGGSWAWEAANLVHNLAARFNLNVHIHSLGMHPTRTTAAGADGASESQRPDASTDSEAFRVLQQPQRTPHSCCKLQRAGRKNGGSKYSSHSAFVSNTSFKNLVASCYVWCRCTFPG